MIKQETSIMLSHLHFGGFFFLACFSVLPIPLNRAYNKNVSILVKF